MLRYLPGLLLVQLMTLGLFALNADADPQSLALRAALPAFALTVVTALWFRSLARADSERDLARTRLAHEKEREALHRKAADERVQVERDAARSIRREERRTGRRANVKIGLAFAAVSGMGVLFVLSELVTLGLLTLSTGGGALGGYVLRWRQTRQAARIDTDIGDMPALEVLAPGSGRGSSPATETRQSSRRLSGPAAHRDKTV